MRRKRWKEAFLQWARRKVSVQGIIGFGGQEYHVDPTLAEQDVLVRYNPFDLSRIWLWKDGKKLCCATPDALIYRTLARRPKKSENSASSASELYLQSLEQVHRHNLEMELNLMRLEDEENE